MKKNDIITIITSVAVIVSVVTLVVSGLIYPDYKYPLTTIAAIPWFIVEISYLRDKKEMGIDGLRVALIGVVVVEWLFITVSTAKGNASLLSWTTHVVVVGAVAWCAFYFVNKHEKRLK